jgi:hypothetical protein
MPPKPSGLYYTHHNIPKPNDLENWSHSYYEVNTFQFFI